MHEAADLVTGRPGIRVRRNEEDGRSNPFRVEDGRRATGIGNPAARVELHRCSLLAIQRRLRGEVTQAMDATLGEKCDVTSASPDAAEQATESSEQDVTIGVIGTAADSLVQIEAALRRIEEGSYGRCLDCDAEIPDTRLEAIPFAPCCIRCATRRERRGRSSEG